jgi:hypothetical protein
MYFYCRVRVCCGNVFTESLPSSGHTRHSKFRTIAILLFYIKQGNFIFLQHILQHNSALSDANVAVTSDVRVTVRLVLLIVED